MQRLRKTRLSAEDAADVAQDVAVRMLRTGSLGRDQQHFEAMAMQTARWAFIDRWRELSRDAQVLTQAAVEEAGEHGTESRLSFMQAVATLSTRERQVLELHLDGESPARIAARLGMTESTARSLLRFAKLRLGRALF